MAVVGLLTLELRIADARSLKDRRQVVRALKQRLRNRFNVAVAEVEAPTSWTLATIGVAAVAGSQGTVEEILRRVEADAAEMLGGDLAESSIELF